MLSKEVKEDKTQELKNLYTEAKVINIVNQEFHLTLTNNFDCKHLSHFNKINKSVLTKLMEINEVIKDTRIIQIYYNVFNYLFSICDEKMYEFDQDNHKIKYMLYTALSYTNKIENSQYLELFRKKILNDGIEMKIVNTMEIMILNNSSKFYKISSEEIFENLIFLINLPRNGCLYEKFNTILNFALSESTIYLTFDLFVITFSCLLITLKFFKQTEIFTQSLRRILAEINLKEERINSCINLIMNNLFQENEEVSKGKVFIRIHKKKHTKHKVKKNKLKSHRKIRVFG